MDKKMNYYYKIIAKVIIILFILLGIFLTYKLAIFYMPFLIALAIATLIEPIIKFFTNKFKMKRKVATTISLILVIVIIGTLLVLLCTKIISEGNNLISNLNVYFKDVYNFCMDLLNDYQEGNLPISNEIIELIKNSLGGFLDTIKTIVYSILTGTINFITSIPTILTYSIMTILAVVFICLDREHIINLAKKHIPSKIFDKIKLIFKQVCSVTIKYIKAEAKLSLMCFILVLVGLTAFNLFGLKVEYLVIMATFIGFIDLLPIFGAGSVMIPWAIYLYFSGNIPLAIAVTALWIVWAVFKQLIEPKFISNQMEIHPIFTLIGMYTGFRLIGVFGLILGPIAILIIKNIFSGLIDKGVLKTFFEME